MMLNLAGPIVRPKSGAAKSILVLLHGYGSDGQDLIGLAPLFADLIDSPLIFAPNAPESCPLNPAGYQWFALNSGDDLTRLDGIEDAAMSVHVLLESLWSETGLGPADTMLGGFSQGGMLALYAGLSRDKALAGIMSFSGGLPFDTGHWPEIESEPPVLLVHGDMDEVVPSMMTTTTANGLKVQGIKVEKHISPGCPHAIAPDSIEAARAFVSAHMKPPQGAA